MDKRLSKLAMSVMAAGMIAGASSCVSLNDQNVEYNDNSTIIQNNVYRSGGCYGTDAYKKQQSKLWPGNGSWQSQSNSVTKNVNIDNSHSRDISIFSNREEKIQW